MKRWLRGLVFGTMIGMVGVGLALTPYFMPLETRVGLYTHFHLRGVVDPPGDVVVVAIDGRTGEKLGLPELPREWPRTIHGLLVEQLVQRGAAVIVFDIDFRRARDEQADSALAQAFAQANRVVLFAHLNGRLQPIEDSDGRHRGAVWLEEAEPPLPALAKAVRALGPFPLPKLDAAVDQFWTFKASAQDTPTMPAAALQLYALPSYGLWRDALATGSTAPLDELPLSAEAVRNANQMNDLMLTTRQMFAENPDLAAAVKAAAAADGRSARSIGALLALYTGENDRYLNYYGPPGTITTVPYHAVIKGQDPNLSPGALDFTGKVVFVGHSDLFDPGQPDRFYTVFTRADGVDLSGVEIAATAFANLLTDQSLHPLSAASTFSLLLLFGLVLGMILYLVPGTVGVALAVSLAAVYATLAQLSFNSDHLWWPTATPLLIQLPFAVLIGLFVQYRLEHRRATHISEAIRAYVPAEVSRILTAPGVDANNINKVTYGTCLATDMAGFSTIAEKMAPGDLARFLNEYFDVLAQALQRHGVQVTEFRADAIMCAWTGSPDDASVRSRPVLAALDAAQEINRFNLQRGLSGNLRVGLADGEFFVGHAGGGGHFVYSIVGDCANTASRIEGLNKHLGTQILATSTVLQGQDDLLLRYLGKFRFVGKGGSMPITEVVAPRASASAAQIDLCERFAPAQAAFAQRNWARAVELLEQLALTHPYDAPTRFLLIQAQSYRGGLSAPDESGLIVMGAK